MEACAENNIPLLILDRPNPNGHYVDGPIMEEEYKSFLGMHSVPIVHGLTLGEFAQMINGEGWLNNNKSCNLKIIKIENYHHQTRYELPVRPSPNLPIQNPLICILVSVFLSKLQLVSEEELKCNSKSLDIQATQGNLHSPLIQTLDKETLNTKA